MNLKSISHKTMKFLKKKIEDEKRRKRTQKAISFFSGVGEKVAAWAVNAKRKKSW